MNRFARTTAAVAALAVVAFAAAAQAQEVRISVTDLSQPAQRAAFDQRLAKASMQFCGSRLDNLAHQSTYETCVAAVHEEALSQLSPAHLQQYAAAATPVRVASNDR